MNQPDPTTPAGRAALRELAAAASRLPWTYRPHGDADDWGLLRDADDLPVGDTGKQAQLTKGGVKLVETNGVFVAAAANALPVALDTIDRLTADNELLRAYLLQLLDARDSPPSDEPNTDHLSARLDQIEDVLRGLS